jgi:phage gp16-like protein
MNRRNFLRSAIFGASTILVGDEVLDAFNRLTWKRKYFPGETFGESSFWSKEVESDVAQMLRDVYGQMRTTIFPTMQPLFTEMPSLQGGRSLYFDVDIKPPKITRGGYLLSNGYVK